MGSTDQKVRCINCELGLMFFQFIDTIILKEPKTGGDMNGKRLFIFIILSRIKILLLPMIISSFAESLNYTAGYGEMEMYENYYFNHKPVPRDTLWPEILVAAGISFSANDTIKPYLKTFIDFNNKISGAGSQFVYLKRTVSDTKDRTITLSFAYIDTTTNKTFGIGTNFPTGDSLLILISLKTDSVQNVICRLRILINSTYTTISTFNSNIDWITIPVKIYLADTIWRVRPILEITANKNGNNLIKLWVDNLRMYAINPNGSYKTLPVLPMANFKLVSFRSEAPDWITAIAKHDLFRGDKLAFFRFGLVKPEAELFHYVMTSAAYIRYTVTHGGQDTIWRITYLGGGDFYPHSYIKDSLNWGFIRDSLGRVVSHLWPFNDTSFSREDYVRYGSDGEYVRNIFYKNLRWLYDSVYTIYKPTGYYFDNFLHPISMVPDGSPDYETNTIRKQKHYEFTQMLKNRLPEIPFFAGLSADLFDSYKNYVDYIMRCSFTVSCEFGAGKWVSPKTTYDWIKIITQNPQKKYVLLAGVVNDQQILYTAAAFYMVNGENVYVLMHDTSGGKYCHYSCTIYPTYYYLPIGHPTNSYQVVAMQDSSKGFVFLKRNYSNGVVLLNLDTLNAYQYVLERSYFDHNNTYYDSGAVITINPRSGFIFIGPETISDKNRKLFYVPTFFNNKIEIKYFGFGKSGLTLKLYNALGALVFKAHFKCTETLVIQDQKIAELSEGTYYLHIYSGRKLLGKAKLIKLRNKIE